MKEVITIQMVEQKTVKFVADDGKTFDKEKDCKEYELGRKRKDVEARFHLIEKQKIDIPMLSDYKGEGCIYKITFNSREDVNALVDYYTLYHFYMDYVYDAVKKVTSFPFTTLMDEGYDSIYFFDEDTLRKDIAKLIEQLDSHNNPTVSK